MGNIGENLERINEQIEIAAEKSDRTKDDICLVAVTKTKPLEMLRDVIDNGIIDLGENRVQELIMKMEEIDDDVRWHMIGHLQKNKVKYLIDKIYMIHSVDSIDLAQEISKRSISKDKVTKVLIQINVSGEETKYGIKKENAIGFLQKCSEMKGIKVCGLMTMAPYIANESKLREIFSDMYQLMVDIRGKNMDNIYMNYLSMGMSNDFTIAIEEGSNMVRIGSALLGSR